MHGGPDRHQAAGRRGLCKLGGRRQNSFVQTFEELYKQISEALPQTVEGIESMLDGAAQAMEEADESIAQAFNG